MCAKNYARCADASHDMPPAGFGVVCCPQAAGTHTYPHRKICRQASNRTNSRGVLGPSSSCTQQQHQGLPRESAWLRNARPWLKRAKAVFFFGVVFVCMMHEFTAHNPRTRRNNSRHVLARHTDTQHSMLDTYRGRRPCPNPSSKCPTLKKRPAWHCCRLTAPEARGQWALYLLRLPHQSKKALQGFSHYA